MMTVRKMWCVHEKKFTFTAEVSKINQILEDLHDFEMQYLIGYICYDTYVERVRKYLTVMDVPYTEIEEV